MDKFVEMASDESELVVEAGIDELGCLIVKFLSAIDLQKWLEVYVKLLQEKESNVAAYIHLLEIVSQIYGSSEDFNVLSKKLLDIAVDAIKSKKLVDDFVFEYNEFMCHCEDPAAEFIRANIPSSLTTESDEESPQE